IERAGVGPDALAGVDEQEGVEALQGVLAVARDQLVQGLDEHRRLVLCARPLGVVAALLADLDPVEDLALDREGAAGLLLAVVVQAAEDRRPGLAGVEPAAEQRLLPLLRRDLGVVLHVGVLNADDSEAQHRLLPRGARRRAVVAAAAAREAAPARTAALAAPA